MNTPNFLLLIAIQRYTDLFLYSVFSLKSSDEPVLIF